MERDDREMFEVTRDWRTTVRQFVSGPGPVPAWIAFVAFIALVLVAIFSINAFAPGGIGDLIGGSGDGDAGGSTDAAPAIEEPAPAVEPADGDTGEDAGEPAEQEPAHFVGTIVSDNGWFTVTVTDDGLASGTLSVRQVVEGDTAVQSGSFTGTIDVGDVVTCNGTFSGTTYDSEGGEWPHQGTVWLRATPTVEDRSVWLIEVDGEPGSPGSFPAHRQ